MPTFDFLPAETWTLIGRLAGLLVFVLFGIWLFRASRDSAALLVEVRRLAPVVAKIAKDLEALQAPASNSDDTTKGQV